MGSRSRRLSLRASVAVLLAIVLTIAAAPPPVAAGGSAGRTLVLDYWQMPMTLNPHLVPRPPSPAPGTPSSNAARLILEPLASIGPDGTLVPALAATIPTLANGGISPDLRVITWTLRPGVQWSDGTAFTADDVVFTYDYLRDPAVGAVTAFETAGIASVVARGAHTVVVTYSDPTSDPYRFGVGATGAILQRAQFAPSKGANAASAPGNLAPVGTGPYKLRSFTPDRVSFVASETYRLSRRPFFRAVEIVRTADALASAQAVFRDGTADFSWNVLLDLDVLRSLIAVGKGDFVSPTGHSVERVLLNRADPSRESEPTTSHPFFSDPRVRKAFAMAVDRAAIARLYGPGMFGDATCNLVTGIPAYTSPNTAAMDVCRYDIGRANALLDEAGWTDRDAHGIRMKNGIVMRVLFRTTIHVVRTHEYEIMAAGWRQLGVDVLPLSAVPAGRFFTNWAPDGANHFWADLEMFTSSPSDLDYTEYMSSWLTRNIAQRSNNWTLMNFTRFSSPAYDALFTTLTNTSDPQARAALIVKMNDLLVSDVVEIPLIARRVPDFGKAKSLCGVIATSWDDETWNIAGWSRAGPAEKCPHRGLGGDDRDIDEEDD